MGRAGEGWESKMAEMCVGVEGRGQHMPLLLSTSDAQRLLRWYDPVDISLRLLWECSCLKVSSQSISKRTPELSHGQISCPDF